MFKKFFKLILGLILAFIAIMVVMAIIVASKAPSSSDDTTASVADRSTPSRPDARVAAEPPKPKQAAQDSPSQRPTVSASLSGFKVDRESAQFVFTLKVKNEQPKENTVYVVVYGKNDMFSPPRRSAWPFAGLLFRQAGTRRGQLSSSDISRNWNSKDEILKGAKLVLKPRGSESLEAALPINETCQHEAWRGKPLDPRSMYNEVYLWVFSEDGNLIFKKKYDVK